MCNYTSLIQALSFKCVHSYFVSCFRSVVNVLLLDDLTSSLSSSFWGRKKSWTNIFSEVHIERKITFHVIRFCVNVTKNKWFTSHKSNRNFQTDFFLVTPFSRRSFYSNMFKIYKELGSISEHSKISP